MKLKYHGGKCCGIKHVADFDTGGPAWVHGKVGPLDGTQYLPVLDGGSNIPWTSFFSGTAPKESTAERFVRYLEYLQTTRPGGLVEVVLADYKGGRHKGIDQLCWVPFLEQHGFSFVTRCYNSNSDNYIYVFHLAMEPEGKKSSTNASQRLFPWADFGLTPEN